MSIDHATSSEPRRVRETHDASVPALVHPDWMASFPWLLQGTTIRGAAERAFDLGLFSDASPGHQVDEHWNRLLEATGMAGAIHAQQLHETEVRFHRRCDPGLHIANPCDGHATDQSGVLLAVTTADCVPVFVLDPDVPAVAVLHAGWRGAAAGVLEQGLSLLGNRTGSRTGDLHVHLGPAICGTCYEVGPEVFEALARPGPAGPTPIDLRAILAERAVTAGVDPLKLSVSEHCTRCTDSGLFSHRGGDRARQVAYVGIRP